MSHQLVGAREPGSDGRSKVPRHHRRRVDREGWVSEGGGPGGRVGHAVEVFHELFPVARAAAGRRRDSGVEVAQLLASLGVRLPAGENDFTAFEKDSRALLSGNRGIDCSGFQEHGVSVPTIKAVRLLVGGAF